ncbi:MAG: hypothetical protein KC619_13615 [Myxococcales bacterium]|nr:hypothetical protein [Myxococcales bacterium]
MPREARAPHLRAVPPPPRSSLPPRPSIPPPPPAAPLAARPPSPPAATLPPATLPPSYAPYDEEEGDTLVEGLEQARSKGLTRTVQEAARVTYAPLLEKKDSVLDFRQPAAELERRVRALEPWPGTQFGLGGTMIKVRSARVVPNKDEIAPRAGSIQRIGERLIVATGHDGLELVEIQPPGKRPMPAADFLRGSGRNIQTGDAVDPISPPSAATPSA